MLLFKFGHFAFFDLGTTYDVHLGLIGSGLPITVNWTFFARCYGWGVTSEYRL